MVEIHIIKIWVCDPPFSFNLIQLYLQIEYHADNFILDTSIYDTVFLMSNFSNLWDQLTTVYPKVYIYNLNRCSFYTSFIYKQEQILLLNGDDFTSAPLKVLRDVEKFIGVPQFFNENHFNFSGPVCVHFQFFNWFIFFKLHDHHFSFYIFRKKRISLLHSGQVWLCRKGQSQDTSRASSRIINNAPKAFCTNDKKVWDTDRNELSIELNILFS